MSELKPCPFCGDKPVHIKPTDECENDYIRCDTCGIDMDNEFDYVNGVMTATCVKLWNTRANPWQPIETAPQTGDILCYAASTDSQNIVDAREIQRALRCASIEGDKTYYTHWQPKLQPPITGDK